MTELQINNKITELESEITRLKTEREAILASEKKSRADRLILLDILNYLGHDNQYIDTDGHQKNLGNLTCPGCIAGDIDNPGLGVTTIKLSGEITVYYYGEKTFSKKFNIEQKKWA